MTPEPRKSLSEATVQDIQLELLRRTCFSVEPGIYLPEFGVRSEVNIYIDKDGGVHVTGGPLQTEVRRVLV